MSECNNCGGVGATICGICASPDVNESKFIALLSDERFKAVKQALTDLVDLKEYKDKNGKDKAYRLMQPDIWQRAFDALGR